jgi:hypothetical protein
MACTTVQAIDNMREGTTSRVMADDKPYDEFYDFDSVSPEYFGYNLVVYLIVLFNYEV